MIRSALSYIAWAIVIAGLIFLAAIALEIENAPEPGPYFHTPNRLRVAS